MENKNEPREITQEELDKIVGGYLSTQSRITQQQHVPGIPCPSCNNLIPISIQQLLFYKSLFCPFCGLHMTVDKDRAEKALIAIERKDEEIIRRYK